MIFKNHVEEILQAEALNLIEQQGYFLENEFCSVLCEKYHLSRSTVIGTMRRIYPEVSLIKRRMTDELKDFFNVEVKGYPIVYMPDK